MLLDANICDVTYEFISKSSLTRDDVLDKVLIHVNINIAICNSLWLEEIVVYRSYIEFYVMKTSKNHGLAVGGALDIAQ